MAVVRGTVSVSSGESRNVGYVGLGSRLRINGLAFTITFEAGSAFAAHVQYIVYYLPKSQIVLAAERDRH
ncbi:MAG: hypothetical protein KF716_15600 [Anaerolineae bacterium]|nr:hypothetical protein [Anaerolineae bacterium]